MRSSQYRSFDMRPRPHPAHYPQVHLYTPSPTSASSVSSAESSVSSAASSASSSSSSSAAPPRPRQGSTTITPVAPMLADLECDSGLWSSIRLASSPPSALSRPSQYQQARASTTNQHHHHDHSLRSAHSMGSTTLSMDDFNQDRMSHRPGGAKNKTAVLPLDNPLKSSMMSGWSLRRAKTLEPTVEPPPASSSGSSSSSLSRTHSLQDKAFRGSAAAAMPVIDMDADVDSMDHRVFIARDQWVHHRNRRACVVCDREFGMMQLRKKHTCRMCGEVVCNRCSLFKNVKLPGVGDSKARVCSPCFLQYRQRFAAKPPLSAEAPIATTTKTEEAVVEEQSAVTDDDQDGGGCSGYDSNEELPSVEDVMRRTAAKFAALHTPRIYAGAPQSFRQPKPVSLLAPELMDSMYRASSCFPPSSTTSGRLTGHSSVIQYESSPSMVLLSPTMSIELLDMQLFERELMPSFCSTTSSTLSSCLSSLSSSASSSSLSSSGSMSSTRMEEELAAAIKARELEKEVEASRDRIQELERRMEEQEAHKAELSLDQQNQLREAKELIAQLQQQLKQQEQNARDAALTRDSICLSNLRQQQQHGLATPSSELGPRSRSARSNSVEAESEALRLQLRLLERQLQQAGINVAEVIPYKVAKQKITEIARRMAEISEAEATMKLDNPKGVVALRREYYVLEQDMERFHTALLMSDEYLAEQLTLEKEWELRHVHANLEALRRVRSALPVEISQLSEQALRTMATPSGKPMSADLARRFKRTNVLQLLRVAPQTITRMHPSVIDNYRTAGLTLLERRALHAALRGPASDWQRQARDELAQKKAAWFKKLKDAFVQALYAYEQHMAKHHHHTMSEGKSDCPFIGKMCVMRAEQVVAALYSAQLGFPETDEFLEQEIIKGDPEGAGEKALHEAKSHVQATKAAMMASVRQAELKKHYGMKNVRQVTMALAALNELDAAMERLQLLDASAAAAASDAVEDGRAGGRRGDDHDQDEKSKQMTHANQVLWEKLVSEARELISEMARRAGICLTGKRDTSKDALDTRSLLEASASQDALLFVVSLVEDVARTSVDASHASSSRLKNALARIRELLADVEAKNDALLMGTASRGPEGVLTPVVEGEPCGSARVAPVQLFEQPRRASSSWTRLPWSERGADKPLQMEETIQVTTRKTLAVSPVETMPPSATATAARPRMPLMGKKNLSGVPRSSFLLDAIRAKRNNQLDSDAANDSSVAVRQATIPESVSTPVLPVEELPRSEPAASAIVLESKSAAVLADLASVKTEAPQPLEEAVVAAAASPIVHVEDVAFGEPVELGELFVEAVQATPAPATPAATGTVAAVVTNPATAQTTATSAAQKPSDFLAAIRARKAKAAAIAAAPVPLSASVDHAALTA